MAAHARLLPPHSATPLELALSETVDPWARLADVWGDIPSLTTNPPPNMLPFVVWEYGLGELSPYVPNLYNLISEGVRWQRVRGTPDAIRRGLGWVGYTATIEEAPVFRRRWNRFQLALDRVRDRDDPDLDRIENITGLSVPVRSKFSRGFAGYDVRAAETSRRKTSNSIFSTDSGVRMHEGGPLWSFGRQYEVAKVLTQAELTALGVWQPAVSSTKWADMHIRWADAHFKWADDARQARRNVIATGLSVFPAWVVFRRPDSTVIGYRRATVHPVRTATTGEYAFDGNAYAVSTAPSAMLVHAMTGFGDGAGEHVASVSVLIGATPTDAVKPGRLWLAPGGLSGGVEVGSTPLSIELGQTVRERVRFMLSLDGPY